VHNFKFVAVEEFGSGPLRARDDLAIQFHGHAIALHPERFDQSCDVRGGREFFFFAIYQQFHVTPKITPTGLSARIAFDVPRGLRGALQRKLNM